MIEPKSETAMFAALHENITNKYIESMFKNRRYEEFSPKEKLEIIGVLKRTSKVDVRYQA
tara:strand:+ start:367 stop:546 length:180 start_codon:yes stop_codon:yes gene_type:complete